LNLRARGGQAVFQQGETINLELSFTTSVSHKYQIDRDARRRWSSWKNLGGIAVKPQTGWDDPLDLYYRARNFQIWSGSILSSSPKELSAEPVIVHVELNESVRFKDPGKYTVSVKSTHASKLRVENEEAAETVVVESNELQLTIVPARKEWAQQTLNDALSVLDSAEPLPDSAQMDALRTLKYLGTTEAAHAILQRWRQKTEWHATFVNGLVRSLAREAVLKEMKGLLVDPNFAVDTGFLTTMAFLALPPGTKENEPALLTDITDSYLRDLKLAMASKSERAWSVSLQTLSAFPLREEW
jgi:hypothetical protein